MCDCAGGAVLKKIAARLSFRGTSAERYDKHMLQSHTV
jgi:hypothetical protein